MNTESHRWVFWSSAGFTIAAILVGSLLFHHSDKTLLNEEKERSSTVKWQEQPQVQTSQGDTQLNNQEVQENPIKLFKRTLDEQSCLITMQPKTYSLDNIMPPLESSNQIFKASIVQISEQIVKDVEQQFAKAENKLEKTKVDFNDALNSRNSVKLRGLINEADEEEKIWIHNNLLRRFNSESDPKIRRVCLLCLAKFPESASGVLVRALSSDEDYNVRRLAAYMLGQKGSEHEVDALLQAVKDDKGTLGGGRAIARVAIGTLGEIGGTQAAKAIMQIWKSEELSRGCREQTLTALGMAGDPAAFEVLKTILKSDNELLRDNAVFGLGRLAKRNQDNQQLLNRTTALMCQYITDTNPRVRSNVADALGYIGGWEDVQLLQTLLQDEYSVIVSYSEDGVIKKKTVYRVREKAREAIERINKRFPLEKGALIAGQASYREKPVVFDVNETVEPNLPAGRVTPFRTYTLVAIGVAIAVAGVALLVKKKLGNSNK